VVGKIETWASDGKPRRRGINTPPSRGRSRWIGMITFNKEPQGSSSFAATRQGPGKPWLRKRVGGVDSDHQCGRECQSVTGAGGCCPPPVSLWPNEAPQLLTSVARSCNKGTLDSDGGRSQGAALVVGVGHRLNQVTRPDTLRLEEWGGRQNW
jgi:hypothetical protein